MSKPSIPRLTISGRICPSYKYNKYRRHKNKLKKKIQTDTVAISMKQKEQHGTQKYKREQQEEAEMFTDRHLGPIVHWPVV